MVVSPYFGGKGHVSNGQNVSFKEPCHFSGASRFRNICIPPPPPFPAPHFWNMSQVVFPPPTFFRLPPPLLEKTRQVLPPPSPCFLGVIPNFSATLERPSPGLPAQSADHEERGPRHELLVALSGRDGLDEGRRCVCVCVWMVAGVCLGPLVERLEEGYPSFRCLFQ